MNNTLSAVKEIQDYIVDSMDNGYEGLDSCDLHNELFNTDYYIVGTHMAKEWLNNYGVFEAIDKIKEYEQDNFGEVNTDLSDPEKVVNILVYIIGEELLGESETLQEVWDSRLTAENIEAIKAEIEAL